MLGSLQGLERADVRCVLCGEQMKPPLVDPTLLSVERADGFDALETISFVVHPSCLRGAAHPSLSDQVGERLDRRT
jgi:hypothetical protein